MPNHSNILLLDEKGHWHKGQAGAEVDKLGRNRYAQLMASIEIAKKSLANQLSSNYAQQKRSETPSTKTTASYDKREAVETARSSVKQAIGTQPTTRQIK